MLFCSLYFRIFTSFLYTDLTKFLLQLNNCTIASNLLVANFLNRNIYWAFITNLNLIYYYRCITILSSTHNNITNLNIICPICPTIRNSPTKFSCAITIWMYTKDICSRIILISWSNPILSILTFPTFLSTIRNLNLCLFFLMLH